MRDDGSETLTIIGIGSSAGGLEAIRELVATLPANLPVSYVVVQHMSPHHKSLMTELVARQTELRVEDVSDGTAPEANVIYITPPKTDVVLKDGQLRLIDPSDLPSAPKPSVDRFLVSLAEDHGSNAVAMILSGTGSDGAYGVQAIREAGGITIAQDSNSAKYDGMPQAAVQTGCVDLVLRPVEIGTHLQKILTSARDFSAFRKEELQETPISDLLQILLARTRVDFRDYKQTTITRRIERRMTALGIDNQDEYTHFLRNNPQAVDALFKDLLISVTRFFRDKEEFRKLNELLPELLSKRQNGPVRVWIAGCATGEEAYSIAMLISEALGGPNVPLKEKVQIFATDIDKEALQVARAGIYSNAALNDIPPDLAKKYLIQHGDGIRITDRLRGAVLFSDHNVCQDPPFQKVHLLCCRNLLIYFGNSLQKKVMARFHYSMASDALLFLGTAESVAGSDELFLQDDNNSHVYRKRILGKGKTITNYAMPSMPLYTGRQTRRTDQDIDTSADRHLFEALVKSLGEKSVLVTEDGTIMSVNGSISEYIEVNQSSKLKMHLELLKSPLREEARSLVSVALRHGAQRTGVRHRMDEKDEFDIRLNVYPIVAKSLAERVAVVAFTPVAKSPDPLAAKAETLELDESVSERIKDLENEVAVTREALQQTIEQLETSNEELQALNEELQSTNEELQATNEELETSNEELQSTNEELITVNEELQITATELSGRTGELTSVLQSTPLAIMVTDSALQITQATTAAAELFQLKQPITTPHISQAVLPEGYPALSPICSETLKLGTTSTQEFSSEGNRVILSCTPYFDVHGKILGLTMVITQFPGLAREMEMILGSSQIQLMNRTPDGTILRMSKRLAETFGLDAEKALGRNIKDLLPASWCDALVGKDERLLASAEDTDGRAQIVEFGGEDGKDTTYLSMESRLFDAPHRDGQSIYNIALDVTNILKAASHTNALIERFRHLQELAGFGYWEINPLTRQIYWSSRVFELHGFPESEGTPDLDRAIEFFHKDDRDKVRRHVEEVSTQGGEFEFTARLIRADGTEIRVQSNGIAILDGTGHLQQIVGAFEEMDD
ncbi:chemotaxis protein CheB [Pseudooctadecabacter jejudonensis]|uniref:protein-glutamate O-methyltransferase n=1 Tax=Pseudooctadecabacter jejudonensis TaxID=1391910 RepID=A0A1Y5T8L1_9RHOB|nr:chemotaxis protein CheB [Pseudooctadecabacter jejudonensis]SLN58117.1 Chemotaxis protein methyltransferase [Pseudooctadecabacter jejudonensis]